jgi:hypothetical protein
MQYVKETANDDVDLSAFGDFDDRCVYSLTQGECTHCGWRASRELLVKITTTKDRCHLSRHEVDMAERSEVTLRVRDTIETLHRRERRGCDGLILISAFPAPQQQMNTQSVAA